MQGCTSKLNWMIVGELLIPLSQHLDDIMMQVNIKLVLLSQQVVDYSFMLVLTLFGSAGWFVCGFLNLLPTRTLQSALWWTSYESTHNGQQLMRCFSKSFPLLIFFIYRLILFKINLYNEGMIPIQHNYILDIDLFLKRWLPAQTCYFRCWKC